MLRNLAVVAAVLMSCGSAGAEDWAGYHAGVAFGAVDSVLTFEGRFGPFDTPMDGDQLGVFVGHTWQSGQITYGGELSLMSGDIRTEGIDDAGIDDLAALKARLGYAFGRVHAYGVLGLGWENYVNGSESKWGNGTVLGLGIETRLGTGAFGGLEYLRYQGDMAGEIFIPPHDTDLETMSLRIGLRF